MKLLSKPTKLSDVGWWLALSVCLLLLYFALLSLGFVSNDSKGLSLLGLLAILAIGLLMQRCWIKSRFDRRFAGLTLDQRMVEMEKVFEEQVIAGVITRAELERLRGSARTRFERKQEGGLGGSESL
jgi:hypothetical protein